jgi:hypothetical protein
MAWELRLSQPRVHVLLLDDQCYKNLWIDIACFIIGSLFNYSIVTFVMSEYEKSFTLLGKSKSASRFLMATLEVLSLAPTWYLTSWLIMDILTQKDPRSNPHNGQMVSFPGVNRPGLGVNYPPSPSADVECVPSYTTAAPQCLLCVLRGRLYLT